MGNIKNIQKIERSLLYKRLFAREGRLYFFGTSGKLESYKSMEACIYYPDGWKNIETLKGIFDEEYNEIIVEALNELREGDEISKFIIRVFDLQSQKWKPVKVKYLAAWKQIDLIERKLLERDGNWYGFNYMGKFAPIAKSSVTSKEARVNANVIMDAFSFFTETSASFKIIVDVVKKLKIGDTIETFIDNITKERKRRKEQYELEHPADSIDRFITKIETPILERATGNVKKGTFDFVRVNVGIITSWHEDRKKYITKNQQEITKRVLEKVANNKRFQAMGVPINFLEITSITLTRDSILEFVFELKIK